MHTVSSRHAVPAHVVEGFQHCQAISLIHAKQGIMQHQQLAAVHELARHCNSALCPHWKMICTPT